MFRKGPARDRLRNIQALMLCLPLLTALSVVLTVISAATNHARLNWMVILSLVFIFLNVLLRARVRSAFKTLHRFHGKRRKKHSNAHERTTKE